MRTFIASVRGWLKALEKKCVKWVTKVPLQPKPSVKARKPQKGKKR